MSRSLARAQCSPCTSVPSVVIALCRYSHNRKAEGPGQLEDRKRKVLSEKLKT